MALEEKIKTLDAIIAKKGGTRLTQTVSPLKPIDIKCSSGHKFTDNIFNIIKDKWCPECKGGDLINSITDIFRRWDISAEGNTTINSVQYTLVFKVDEKKYMCIDVTDNESDIKQYKERAINCVKHNNCYSFLVKNKHSDILEALFLDFFEHNPTVLTNSENFINYKVDGDNILNYVVIPNKTQKPSGTTSCDEPKQISTITNVAQNINAHIPILLPNIPSTTDIKSVPIKLSIATLDIKDVKSDPITLNRLNIIDGKGDIKKDPVAEQKRFIREEKKVLKDKVTKKVEIQYDNELNEQAMRLAKETRSTHPITDQVVYLRVVGYVRVSTEDQRREGISLEAQMLAIKEYARKTGVEMGPIYGDPGISGKKIDNRPGLKQCLRELRVRDELVCANVSRLSRRIFDSLSILNEIKTKKAALKCLDVEGNMKNCDTQFYFNLRALLAEKEQQTISERIKAAMRQMAIAGKLRYKPIFGYKIVDKKIVENPDEMNTIDRIRYLITKDINISRAEICRRLEEHSCKCRNAKEWHHGRLTTIMMRHGLWDPKICKNDPNGKIDLTRNIKNNDREDGKDEKNDKFSYLDSSNNIGEHEINYNISGVITGA